MRLNIAYDLLNIALNIRMKNSESLAVKELESIISANKYLES